MHEEMGHFSGRPISAPLAPLRQSMRQQLWSWHSEVPQAWWIESLMESGVAAAQPSVAWSMAVTEASFWASLMLIYKDDMLVELSPHTKPEFMAEHLPQVGFTRQLLQQAANGYIDVMVRAMTYSIGHFLPPAFLHGIFQAAAVQSRSAASPDPSLCQHSLRNLTGCLEALKRLLDKAPTMTGVVAKMEQALQALTERLLHEQQDNTPPDLAGSAHLSSTLVSAKGVGSTMPHYLASGDDTTLHVGAAKAPEENSGPNLAFERHVLVSYFPDIEM
ncbi:hypothetical protein BJX64DRAFT_286153 [Aspergillus heterothallicus]